jgi:hypothetical protein
MHEKAKLNEAQYFYSRMVEEQNNVENFKYNLSAFLLSSRSELHYALGEAKTIAKGQNWHDTIVSSSLLCAILFR